MTNVRQMRHTVGLLLALAGFSLSAILALGELGRLEPFGCGAESACAQAAAGSFGRLPLLGIPWSFVGTTWFAGILGIWLTARRALPQRAKTLLRIGALVSLCLLLVIVIESAYCGYCIGIHVCSLLLFALARKHESTVSKRSLGTGLLFAATVAGLLALFDTGLKADRLNDKQDELQQAIDRAAAGEDLVQLEVRHHFGAEVSPLRVIFYTDYQCPDCRLVERAFAGFTASHPEVAWSVKHYPLSTCNPRFSRNLHPDACWAARAIEAIAELESSADVEQLHHWLFERKGDVGWSDLEAHLAARGKSFDGKRFFETMNSAKIEELIVADCEEAYGIGLESTPLVVVNGTALRGWRGPEELMAALEELLRRTPAARSFGKDSVLSGPAVDLERWRTAAPADFSALKARVSGDPAGPEAVLCIDVTQAESAQVLQALVETHAVDTLALRIVPFPLDAACNPVVDKSFERPGACLAARLITAVKGADQVGLAKLLSRRPGLLHDHDRLREALLDAGFDPQLLARSEQDDVLVDLRRNISVVRSRGIVQIPGLAITGRTLPYRRIFFERALALVLAELPQLQDDAR